MVCVSARLSPLLCVFHLLRFVCVCSFIVTLVVLCVCVFHLLRFVCSARERKSSHKGRERTHREMATYNNAKLQEPMIAQAPAAAVYALLSQVSSEVTHTGLLFERFRVSGRWCGPVPVPRPDGPSTSTTIRTLASQRTQSQHTLHTPLFLGSTSLSYTRSHGPKGYESTFAWLQTLSSVGWEVVPLWDEHARRAVVVGGERRHEIIV